MAHVSNATRLWVSLLQHSPLCRGGVPVPSHDASTIMKLSLDLADYYAFPDHRQLHGMYCSSVGPGLGSLTPVVTFVVSSVCRNGKLILSAVYIP